jgi:predicted DNA-binding transcriptional regulator YafY
MSAFDKIRSVLSREALQLIDDMRQTLGVRSVGTKLQAAVVDHLPVIQRALRERRRLRLRYYSMHRDQDTEREVDAYHFTDHAGGLYVIAYCHLLDDVRIFAVERLRAAQLLRDRYGIPADFDPVAYLTASWMIVRGDRIRIKVAFARTLAPYIAERLWKIGGAIKEPHHLAAASSRSDSTTMLRIGSGEAKDFRTTVILAPKAGRH